MNHELGGKVAVVTGGHKGLGREIAMALAREGADLVIVGRDPDALEQAAAAIRALGRRATGVSLDITKPQEVARIGEAIRAQHGGRVDIIVTSAGQRDTTNKLVEDADLAHFDKVMQANLNGTMLPIREMIPFMKAARSGKIVALTGGYGIKAKDRHAATCTSKAAVGALVRVLAIELGPFNINVNSVCPGYVEGPRAQAHMAGVAAGRNVDVSVVRGELEQTAALKRLSTPDDIANAVLFLVSERARNITGLDVIVDGGWLL